MTETSRKPAPLSERESKIRELLRQGESFFSQGRYQQAGHVWTRVLFLDRGNPEARAAIERAKQAVAERQRQLDLAAHEAARRLEEGDRTGARRLLNELLAHDPRHIEGRSLSEKLESLERRGETRSVSLSAPELVRPRPGKRLRGHDARKKSISPLKMAAFWFATLCSFAAGAAYLHLNWDSLVNDRAFAFSRNAEPLIEEIGGPLALPSLSELRFMNGARLYAQGAYRDALEELARVDRRSAFAEQARTLILRIEERLLRDPNPAPRSESPTPGSSR